MTWILKKPSFKLNFDFAVLTVVTICLVCNLNHAASSENSSKQNSLKSFFDPFEMTRKNVNISANRSNASVSGQLGIMNLAGLIQASAANSGNSANRSNASGNQSRSRIRIPYRPPFRSPGRPPWVPGPGPWWPGDPPWVSD